MEQNSRIDLQHLKRQHTAKQWCVIQEIGMGLI